MNASELLCRRDELLTEANALARSMRITADATADYPTALATEITELEKFINDLKNPTPWGDSNTEDGTPDVDSDGCRW